MADSHRRSSGTGAATRRHQQHPKPSRLQRRAPATLQVNRSSDWNVAIPLLSPLVSPSSSPTAATHDQTHNSASTAAAASLPENPPVFKKWHHPAAPFHYDNSGSRPPRLFVPV